jgi:hypothetical protein
MTLEQPRTAANVSKKWPLEQSPERLTFNQAAIDSPVPDAV